jgi:hypothetical protein
VKLVLWYNDFSCEKKRQIIFVNLFEVGRQLVQTKCRLGDPFQLAHPLLRLLKRVSSVDRSKCQKQTVRDQMFGTKMSITNYQNQNNRIESLKDSKNINRFIDAHKGGGRGGWGYLMYPL